MGADAEILAALSRGRAVLLLGQRHTAGFVDALTQNLAAIARVPGTPTLIDLLARQKADLDAARRVADASSPSDGLRVVCSLPWHTVISSAVDPLVHRALSESSDRSRQLRVLYATRVASLSTDH